jgi:RNA polymerase sigma-70 factor (ECF subfamily)
MWQERGRAAVHRVSGGDDVPEGGDRRGLMALSDAQLIGASQVEHELFAVIYDRHAPALYRYAVRRLGTDAAEDVVSDTMLAAFRARRRYDVTRPDARPWLYGILTREIAQRRRVERNRYRALARAEQNAGSEDAPTDEIAAAVAAQAIRAPLMAALADLAKRDREVLLLTAWADLYYQEIAEALSIPVGTVGSRLNRARRQVRAAVTDLDIPYAPEER